MVIDADGINILSQDKILLEDLPHSSILTPHHGEFRRLVGNWNNDFQFSYFHIIMLTLTTLVSFVNIFMLEEAIPKMMVILLYMLALVFLQLVLSPHL